jgi:hypothetical protein
MREASLSVVSWRGGTGTGSAYSDERAVGLNETSVGDQIRPRRWRGRFRGDSSGFGLKLLEMLRFSVPA